MKHCNTAKEPNNLASAVHLDCYPARINVDYSSKAKTGVLLSMLIYNYS